MVDVVNPFNLVPTRLGDPPQHSVNSITLGCKSLCPGFARLIAPAAQLARVHRASVYPWLRDRSHDEKAVR
jgi:hypothetical protein